MLEDWESRIKTEEMEREKRLEKAKKMEQSWHLLKLCRDMMSREGENWQISKERREEERKQELERHERIERAKKKKETTESEHKCKKLQTKITEQLKKLSIDFPRQFLQICIFLPWITYCYFV